MAQAEQLYNAAYVATYLGDYHDHPFWRPKIDENRRQLTRLFDAIPHGGVWLDLCCGAAQHFAGARADLRCIGLDASSAQIDSARRRHPDTPHEFVQADVRALGAQQLPKADLITVFWGALSYLPSPAAWREVLAALAAQLSTGGRLYLENPSVGALLNFNHSSFAGATGFRVLEVRPDAEPGFHRWTYVDRSARHALLTPDFSTLQAGLAGVGLTARCDCVVQTVEQVIAMKTARSP